MTVNNDSEKIARISTVTMNSIEMCRILTRGRLISTEIASLQSANVRAYDRQMERDRYGIGAIDSGRADGQAAARVMDALAKEDARILENDKAIAALHREHTGLLERYLVLEDESIEAYRELVEYGPRYIEKRRKKLEEAEAYPAKVLKDISDAKAELKKAKESGDAKKIASCRTILKLEKKRKPSKRSTKRSIKRKRELLEYAETSLEKHKQNLKQNIASRAKMATMLEDVRKDLVVAEKNIADDEARIRKSQEMAARLRGNGV